MKQLDITDDYVTGPALAVLITNRIKDTQQYIQRPLPDRIKVRKDQFEDLAQHLRIIDTQDSRDRLLITPLNVMELEVV